jgi:hypothetical protein
MALTVEQQALAEKLSRILMPYTRERRDEAIKSRQRFANNMCGDSSMVLTQRSAMSFAPCDHRAVAQVGDHDFGAPGVLLQKASGLDREIALVEWVRDLAPGVRCARSAARVLLATLAESGHN